MPETIEPQGSLDNWDGPYGGVPPFDRATPEAIETEFCAALGAMGAEVEAIATDASQPTFANTVDALEYAGRRLRRVETLLRAFASCRNDESMRSVQLRTAPLRSRLDDMIGQHPALFARVETVAAQFDLTVEQRRLTGIIHRRMVRQGATLPLVERERVMEIHARLAKLQALFAQHVLADEEGQHVLVEDEAALSGLDEAATGSAASLAADRGHAGKWAIANAGAAVKAVMTACADRDVRERVWQMWVGRGVGTNQPVIAEILQLRGEKATLLGYPNFAAFQLDDRMARTPERAQQLLTRIVERAFEPALRQSAELAALAKADGVRGQFEPWDRPYYAEQLRRERFGFDEEAIRPYLSLDGMLEAAFWVARHLYQVSFTEVSGMPKMTAEVRVFEVRHGGETSGALWFDPFSREGKKSGGWTDVYRTAENFRDHVLPLVSVNINLAKPTAGEPTLLTWEEALTVFHEMGHALHALLSDVAYPSFGIMQIAWDMVELPSQINERWLELPEVIAQFARHYRTGEPMPLHLLDQIRRARTYNLADVVEPVAAAIIDMRLHLAADGRPVDAAAIEAHVIKELGMLYDLCPRPRIEHFSHIFGEDRYAAGYYVYFWADAMVADVAEELLPSTAQSLDRGAALRFRDTVLAVGNAVPAEEVFRNFRGRDPDPDALMRRLGLEPS